MLKEHIRKHLIKKMFYEILKNRWQEYHTPFCLVDRMIEKIINIEGKFILVLYNIEFLEQLINKYHILPENIRFIADDEDVIRTVDEMYHVRSEVCSKEDWLRDKKTLIRKIKKMAEGKRFDVCLSNPPYTNGIDLKIINLIRNIVNEMVVVHPATWLIDLKGVSPLFNKTKNIFGNRVKSVDLFNGNIVFGIKLFVPCAITHIVPPKTYEEFKGVYYHSKLTGPNQIIVDYFGEEFLADGVDNITIFGPQWELIRESFLKIIKQYVLNNGSLADQAIKKVQTGGVFGQIARVRGNVSKELTLTSEDFFTLVTKGCEENIGISDESLKRLTFKFNSKIEMNNFFGYCKTYFARFCLALLKNGADISRRETKWIPWLDFTQEWTDEKLFKHFGIDEKTQAYIKEFLPDYYGLCNEEEEEDVQMD